MKKIVVVNASPRKGWNTGSLVREAARGVAEQGASVKVYDVYQQGKFTGCLSCFGCKLPKHEGVCVCQDGLTPILDDIRTADGLILGSPNYLGNVTAGFRSLYERLIFPSITYKTEIASYNTHPIPVLLIMTSNASSQAYCSLGYDTMLAQYQQTLTKFIGPTQVMVSGDTLQVNDYDRYGWTMFDPDMKNKKHEEIFPMEKEKAYQLGVKMVVEPWMI